MYKLSHLMSYELNFSPKLLCSNEFTTVLFIIRKSIIGSYQIIIFDINAFG